MTRAALVKREALAAFYRARYRRQTGRSWPPIRRQENTLASTPFQAILEEFGKDLKTRFACARCASLQTPRNSKDLI